LLCTSCSFLVWLILKPWWRRRYFPPKRRLNFSGLHGVISQKIELFRLKYVAKLSLEISQQSIFSTGCSGCCTMSKYTELAQDQGHKSTVHVPGHSLSRCSLIHSTVSKREELQLIRRIFYLAFQQIKPTLRWITELVFTSNIATGLFSGGEQFQYEAGHRLSWMRPSIFSISHSRQMPEWILKLGHCRFLPNSIQFIIF
jgi:hypothetical protein